MMIGKAENKNSLILQFPVEITTDILSRLPADSLIKQCKLVCKTWRSLIEDPAFVDVHTRHLLRVLDDCYEEYVSTDFIMSLRQPPKAFSDYLHILLQIGKYINPELGFQVSKPLTTKNLDPYKRWGVVGSSNGLICLSCYEDISVYNPCTNEYVDLPRPRFRTINEQYYVTPMAAGFGYSPYTKEYKIVLICSKLYYDQEGTHGGEEVSVYTLGTGKWRIKEDIFQKCTGSRMFTPGVLMNRAIHWTMWRKVPRNADDSEYEIVSFDLTDEEFRRNIVPSPPQQLLKLLGKSSQLTLFGGCLCVTQQNFASSTLDIWVMNNKDKTWTVKFKIPSKKFHIREYFSPIAPLGKSKILVFYWPTGKLRSYDTETGNIVEVNADYDLVGGIIPYKIKSFVSLKALGEDACKMMYI